MKSVETDDPDYATATRNKNSLFVTFPKGEYWLGRIIRKMAAERSEKEGRNVSCSELIRVAVCEHYGKVNTEIREKYEKLKALQGTK